MPPYRIPVYNDDEELGRPLKPGEYVAYGSRPGVTPEGVEYADRVTPVYSNAPSAGGVATRPIANVDKPFMRPDEPEQLPRLPAPTIRRFLPGPQGQDLQSAAMPLGDTALDGKPLSQGEQMLRRMSQGMNRNALSGATRRAFDKQIAGEAAAKEQARVAALPPLERAMERARPQDILGYYSTQEATKQRADKTAKDIEFKTAKLEHEEEMQGRKFTHQELLQKSQQAWQEGQSEKQNEFRLALQDRTLTAARDLVDAKGLSPQLANGTDNPAYLAEVAREQQKILIEAGADAEQAQMTAIASLAGKLQTGLMKDSATALRMATEVVKGAAEAAKPAQPSSGTGGALSEAERQSLITEMNGLTIVLEVEGPQKGRHPKTGKPLTPFEKRQAENRLRIVQQKLGV